jgi:hypothetical protein
MNGRIVRSLAFLLMGGTLALAQTGEIKPNESLVTDGLPAVPASIAEAVGRYTEFRAAALQSWHPTRREMLIATRFADTAQVHRVKSPGGARTQLTFFPDRVFGASYPPKGGDYFVFGKDTGGNEFAQLYRYDLATAAITLLTEGGRSQNGGSVFSRAGDRMAYGSTRRNGKDRDVYLVDPHDPKTDRLLLQVEGGGWGCSTGARTAGSFWSKKASPPTRATCGWRTPRAAKRSC